MPTRTRKDLPEQIVIRGRAFTEREIKAIKRLVERHFDRGRTFISRAVCQKLDWRQPNGWLKDRACRDVLRQLEQRRFLKLPPVMIRRSSSNVAPLTQKATTTLHVTSSTPLTEYPRTISFELAKGNGDEQVWNQVVNTYHYLGHKVTVGRCLKYLVRADGELAGAICFSSAAWNLGPRDRLLNNFMTAEEIRNLVINNSRFLILPHIRIPNLASTILSLATKRIVADWSNYYSMTPQFVETFVEPNRFLGTSYRAANWLEIGTTKGYAKSGSHYHNGQKPKQIFLYGLNRAARRKLLRAMHPEIANDE